MTVEKPIPISQEITDNRETGKRLFADGVLAEAFAGGAAFWEVRAAAVVALLGLIPLISSRWFFKRARTLESSQSNK